MRLSYRILAIVTACIGYSSQALAQVNESNSTDSVSINFGCTNSTSNAQQRAETTNTVVRLDNRLSALQVEANKRKDLPPSSDAEVEAILKLEQDIFNVKSQLALALSRQDCQTATRLPSESLRGATEKAAVYVEVPLVYLTDRGRTADADAANFYGSEFRNDGLEIGTVRVILPLSPERASRPLLKTWKQVVTPKQPRDFIVQNIHPTSVSANIQATLANQITTGGTKRVLLFIHGFNVSFVEATVRGAQLARDLDFEGSVIIYSWPSVGSLLNYSRDEDSGRMAKQHLKQIIASLSANTTVDAVTVLAHSMGARITVDALRELAETKHASSKINNLILAAPDINTYEFERFLAPVIKDSFSFKTTIYMSSNDLPLKISRKLHDYPRLGDPEIYRYLQKGIDIIDTSKGSPMRRSWGHSYVWDNSTVMNDIGNLINLTTPIDQRGLAAAVGPTGIPYWILE